MTDEQDHADEVWLILPPPLFAQAYAESGLDGPLPEKEFTHMGVRYFSEDHRPMPRISGRDG